MNATKAALFWMFGDTVSMRVPLDGPRDGFAMSLEYRLTYDFVQFAVRLLT